jgi:hypothetical protein
MLGRALAFERREEALEHAIGGAVEREASNRFLPSFARPRRQRTVAAPASSTVSIPAMATPITVAYGDGIGPEIMSATLRVLAAAGAAIRLASRAPPGTPCAGPRCF